MNTDHLRVATAAGVAVAAVVVGAVVAAWGSVVLAVAVVAAFVAVAAPRRSTGRPPHLGAHALLVGQIVTFPLCVGVAALSPAAACALLLLQALSAARLVRVRDVRGRATAFLAMFVGLLLWVFGTEALVATLAATATLALLLAARSSDLGREALHLAIARSAAVYLAANVVAYYGLGLRSAGAASRLSGYESFTGLLASRVSFPLAGSLVVPAVFASAYLC